MKNKEDFKEYEKAFLKQNSYLNLISKNDEKFLWEKHIFDSLAIEKFFEKYYIEGKKFRGQEVKLFNESSIDENSQEHKSDKSLPSCLPDFQTSDEIFQPFNLSTDNNFPLSTLNLKLLDIGTGGGFPAVPIAIAYPEIKVFALDSIRKKINAIENIKAELGLKNLHTICDRAEKLILEVRKASGQEGKLFNDSKISKLQQKQQFDKGLPSYLPTLLPSKFDLITSRAVAPLKVIAEYAMPLLKNGGYFIAYKSLKAQEEIDDAKQVLKKYNAKVIDIIQYNLPLKENYTRNLIIIV